MSGFVRTLIVGTSVLATSAYSGSLGAAPGRAQTEAVSPDAVRASINKYCVSCHNDRLRTAGLSLQELDPADAAAHAQTWEKVVGKLRSRAMPPATASRPDEATYDLVASRLESALNAAAARKPNPGHPAVHRLNRAEYTNAVRDLLALDVDGPSLLPPDDQGFGFDNNADLLTMSPGLLDRYLLAARKVSRLAVGDPSIRPSVQRYAVSRLLTQDDRVSEELPFGSRGGIVIRHHFPLDAEYVLRVRLQGNPGRTAGEQVEVRLDGERVKLFTVGGPSVGRGGEGAPDPVLEVRFAAKAGPRMLGVSLVKRTTAPEGVAPARLPVGSISFRAAGIGSIELDGPYNASGVGDTPSRRRIFICRPGRSQDERACATQILSVLARRAYRRPVGEKDVKALLAFYDEGRAPGFDAGIGAALERVLIDPEFLFRIERDPPQLPGGAAYRISDLELASRLSFFLWSSVPDDELLDVAARGKLSDPATLEQQVRRMLASGRASALVENFAAQWLYLRNMRTAAPDAGQFPDFDDNLREAFQRETQLFLESQLREDHGVVDLLTANYTFLNERLARHYQIPNVYGSHFRRVTFDDASRGGLLGQGSILTVTSYATRTSPVLRGKWLLENILGAPPPPPPPDVPALKENSAGDRPLSVRQRMEEHRRNPVCASCHSRMDPLGFALENFDAIGRWRSTDEGHVPIDASGALDGVRFEGPVALKAVLLARRGEFVRTVTEKLLTYALGRGIEYYDRPAVRAILAQAAADDYRWSSLILGIVKSTPFEMRAKKVPEQVDGRGAAVSRPTAAR
jgi:hypothetical protein